ncbi:Uncharacterised protein [Mycobacteroides abscessus subsp. massiliense]|nr:Uncharacterised protein [Mycobacteroides abscessus subsp. massiliense]SKF44078.1 Uncharacterised protein [Mycobacteroides abscessus subsp. massiliense]SKF45844.1 Uncharacterised protein [Mycobacteroides abscessus subsp. massiliense]SKF48918.1 Uncharacterised protein [Mycobacteroides abscessus subsp. massiliense]SKF49627.1 Uncharacterised protein [Mycobacteroides abscessus subsp. massiliense]
MARQARPACTSGSAGISSSCPSTATCFTVLSSAAESRHADWPVDHINSHLPCCRTEACGPFLDSECAGTSVMPKCSRNSLAPLEEGGRSSGNSEKAFSATSAAEYFFTRISFVWNAIPTARASGFPVARQHRRERGAPRGVHRHVRVLGVQQHGAQARWRVRYRRRCSPSQQSESTSTCGPIANLSKVEGGVNPNHTAASPCGPSGTFSVIVRSSARTSPQRVQRW